VSADAHSPLVEVVEMEVVDGRSTRRTHWFVRRGQAWVKAAEWPGAREERREAGPGTVWERVLLLALPEGERLMRVDVRPRPLPPRDPLAYLRSSAPGAAKTTRRLYYSVERGGRLVPAAEP